MSVDDEVVDAREQEVVVVGDPDQGRGGQPIPHQIERTRVCGDHPLLCRGKRIRPVPQIQIPESVDKITIDALQRLTVCLDQQDAGRFEFTGRAVARRGDGVRIDGVADFDVLDYEEWDIGIQLLGVPESLLGSGQRKGIDGSPPP